MVGKYTFSISDGIVRYNISVKRKYTFLNGDTGTGKSYLVDLIVRYQAKRKFVKLNGNIKNVVAGIFPDV